MKNQELLALYIPLVNFLGKVLGTNTEIVLHDVSTPEHSIIAICNGFHSGRKIGDSMTDLALQIKREKHYMNHDYQVNYCALSHGKEFRSSTFFIKNKSELIGLLCINIDLSTSQQLVQIMNQFLESSNLINSENAHKKSMILENLDLKMESLTETVIEKTISEMHIPPKRMTQEEKTAVVQKLNEQGITKMKGAVALIAHRLNISEPSVYRYMNKTQL